MRKRIFTIQNSLKQAALVATCFCLYLASAYAQTPAENLQKAVEIYNALREYEDGLVPAEITEDQISDVKARMEKGIPMLDQVIREGNASEIKTARYFKNNFRYEYMFVLGMKGKNAAAYDICKEIEREMTAYSSADFPLTYTYFDKNYSIKWDNFAPTQAEFYTGYAEIAYNIKKYDDAVRVNRLALNHPNTSAWLKYISLSKMLDLYAAGTAYITETEQLDFAVEFIKTYEGLDAESKETVDDNDYSTSERGIGIVLDKALKNVPAALARSGDAAMASSVAEVNEKTLQLFEISYKNKQTSDAQFHIAADAYARKASTINPGKATLVGIFATDRRAQAISSTDCQGFTNIATQYTYWKQSSKAAEYTKKANECQSNAEKAQKKAIRIARRSNKNFNFYAGAYIFPLLKSNAKRDYGVAVNFAFKKVAWEFSYMKIKINKENIFDITAGGEDAEQDDISRWNGFYAHVQPKFMTKNYYVGPLLGYAKKNFEPLTATVVNDADGMITTENFAPKVTQYIAMVNMGGLGLVKGFGFDMYFGIGATYNQWVTGSPITSTGYTIDNPILEFRKDEYFGLIIRTGITMGINLGRGNMR